jgi:excinuclease UvrABC ATPase subunit
VTAIAVRGARTHTLKNLDVDLPHGRIVVVTGVSGSGKSSLVFDTVHTEAQRQLVETFSTFARQRLPKLTRPDVDSLTNLTTSILIDQKPMGRTLRSTVGTATDSHTYLRLLFARCGSEPGIPSYHLGFNNPLGACPRCEGLGRVVTADLGRLLDPAKSLRDGAILHSDWRVGGWNWRELMVLEMFDVDTPLAEWDQPALDLLLHADAVPITRRHAAGTYAKTWRGIARRLELAGAETEDDSPKANAAAAFLTARTCPECDGLRLNERARHVTLAGLTFGAALTMELTDLAAWTEALPGRLPAAEAGVARPIVAKLSRMLGHLVDIGAGYLHLNRATATLSGGEAQRVKTARQLDCDLTGITYVLDEPSAGLHPEDVAGLVVTLKALRDRGNSLLVVEHDPDVIAEADHVVEIGPGPGRHGGELVFSGPVKDYLTCHAVAAPTSPSAPAVEPERWWRLRGVTAHNLHGVDADIPQGRLVVLTGVAGSGKSTLVREGLLPLVPDAVVVVQSPIGRTSRSTPLSYVGGFDRLRQLFAAANAVKPALFSFNSSGACPTCQGAGILRVEMSFLDEVTTPCEDCEGRRFKPEVLALTLDGRSIADVLDLSVDEALEVLSDRALRRKLELLRTVGLGYLALGQSQSSLSGGEAQRLKIALHLGTEGGLYVLDEPTTGLAVADTAVILGVLRRLVDAGNSVVVIEHNLDVIRAADWILDLGPGGGRHGGRIVAQGPPADIARADTPTGMALARHRS